MTDGAIPAAYGDTPKEGGQRRESAVRKGAEIDTTFSTTNSTNQAETRPRAKSRKQHHQRLGLRARVTATFGLGALVLSAALAGITYETARQYFLHQRQDALMRQAFVNASLVRTALRSYNPNVPQTLASLDSPAGSESILYYKHHWYGSSLGVGQNDLPEDMQRLVTSGTPAIDRYRLRSTPQLAVGVPMPAVRASYFEIFSLADLSRTLRVLTVTLAAAAIATTVAGAIVGRWASGRLLRPLADVSKAAVAIAGGRLDTRLDSNEDKDLAPLATSFNQMADKLQERIEREVRFTSDVSHELRSPLTTLATSLEVLKSHRNELQPRNRQALDLLDAEVRHFQRMVTDLLEISRLDAGSAEPSLEEVQVDQLINQVSKRTMNSREGEPFPVVIDSEVAGMKLLVDKLRFERIVANLVENADLYGGGTKLLEVGKTDGKMTLAVSDDGPGIPQEERQIIFQRFARGSSSKNRREHTGAGLGLSLVAEHVQLLGGSVHVESSPSGGARFVVELPLQEA